LEFKATIRLRGKISMKRLIIGVTLLINLSLAQAGAQTNFWSSPEECTETGDLTDTSSFTLSETVHCPASDGGFLLDDFTALDEDTGSVDLAGRPSRPTRGDDDNIPGGSGGGENFIETEPDFIDNNSVSDGDFDAVARRPTPIRPTTGDEFPSDESYGFTDDASDELQIDDNYSDGADLGSGFNMRIPDDNVNGSNDGLVDAGDDYIAPKMDDNGNGRGIEGSCTQGVCTYTDNGYPGGRIHGTRIDKMIIRDEGGKEVVAIFVDWVEVDRR
jgi:hypothetical protein